MIFQLNPGDEGEQFFVRRTVLVKTFGDLPALARRGSLAVFVLQAKMCNWLAKLVSPVEVALSKRPVA